MPKKMSKLPAWRSFPWLVPIVLVAGLGLAGTVMMAGQSSALKPRPLCEECRRFWDTSPSRMRTVLVKNGHKKTFIFCSVICLCETLENHPDNEIIYIQIIDYTQLEEESPWMLRVEKAKFLFDAEGDEQKSQPPFVIAFPNDSGAEAAAEEQGGELMEWDEVFEECKKLVKEYDSSEEDDHTPLVKGDR
ncbi:nitrous oxide reductase accessory protein NosL [bacterium]|nr:nitrous oxide reductase accessory protein NosL [bacterium]